MKKILFLVNPVFGGGLGKRIAGRIKEYVSVRLAEDEYYIASRQWTWIRKYWNWQVDTRYW